MRTGLLFLTLGVLSAVACAHTGDTGKAQVPQPTIIVEQTSRMPSAAEAVEGSFPVSLRVTVTNNAAVPITFERAQLASLGQGGWTVRPTSRNFGATLAPGATGMYDFPVSAVAGLSMVGNNGPVTLRVTATFKSADGSFTSATTQEVGGNFH
jgi:hypothetical protein